MIWVALVLGLGLIGYGVYGLLKGRRIRRVTRYAGL